MGNCCMAADVAVKIKDPCRSAGAASAGPKTSWECHRSKELELTRCRMMARDMHRDMTFHAIMGKGPVIELSICNHCTQIRSEA